MSGLTLSRTSIDVRLSAREWQLYSLTVIRQSYDSPLTAAEYLQLVARHSACVAALNAAASRALEMDQAIDAWDAFYAEASRWDEFGASDTEPREVFGVLVAKIFGDDPMR
jgi:hypothetical protein